MEKKPGYKTTEFWLAVITSVATLLNQSGVLGSFTLPIESIVTVAGIVISYVIGRSVVKTGEAKATAEVAKTDKVLSSASTIETKG